MAFGLVVVAALAFAEVARAQDSIQTCIAERDELEREVEFRRVMHLQAIAELEALRETASACAPVSQAGTEFRPPEAALVETAVSRVRERLAEMDRTLARFGPGGQR